MQDPPIFARLKEKYMNDENKNFQSPAGDVQDPAEPKQVDTAVETEPQAAPGDPAVESGEEPDGTPDRNVAAPSVGVPSGLGAQPTATERLEAEKESDDS